MRNDKDKNIVNLEKGMVQKKNFASAEEVIEFARANNVKMVRLRFTDLFGTFQQKSIPVERLNADLFEKGEGFDGSSIKGFQEIHESDMLLMPDPATARLDPFSKTRALMMLCTLRDPVSRAPYTKDPRYVAQKAEAFLRSSGIADTSYWGPEVEFFVFNSAEFDGGEASNEAYYRVDSREAIWNSGKKPRGVKGNLAHRPRHKEGYLPAPPLDTLEDFRDEVARLLQDVLGISVEAHHHEVATGGQGEVNLRYDTLVRMADSVVMYKYTVKMVARKLGLVATFMPKPLFKDNGSGMHTHQSLWRDGAPLFFDANEKYANLSDIARWYIGGLLAHAPALLAFCAPTTNSYKRLVPGFEAPVNLVYSKRNRSAAARIPTYNPSPEAKRVEFRCPDPSANPYLAFAAMLMAGIDGIIHKIDPGDPLDKNIFELSSEEARDLRQVPGSLDEALSALESDKEFLMRGGVFTEDLIRTWITWKREKEVDDLRLRPHPREFYHYFDA